eukprot:146942-Chlamydomonas_euryale.AAC.1
MDAWWRAETRCFTPGLDPHPAAASTLACARCSSPAARRRRPHRAPCLSAPHGHEHIGMGWVRSQHHRGDSQMCEQSHRMAVVCVCGGGKQPTKGSQHPVHPYVRPYLRPPSHAPGLHLWGTCQAAAPTWRN